ncbi:MULTISPECIES: DUF916 and DUF3324 domain-containing protein [unclassified Enterococcus]|uniref:DUF916 and DUF3324 domain-containing protein n=1 Tax=unclassified Enterococcus TaxID=2608891 RepID=UPI001F15475F|nr:MULTISPECIES: DUF916 and DUF3324 domain-containing protein [unclassified Enterococcus]
MKKWFIVLMILFTSLLTESAEASEFNFAVNFDLPANQIDKQKTYLDLKMAPGQTQEIDYTLFNHTDDEVTVETLIRSATTNSNGVIEYGDSISKIDESLSYKMDDLASTDKEITIPAHATVKKKLRLTAPEKEIAGVTAGGITFQEKPLEKVNEKKSVGVVNRFSQVKAILIRNSEKESSPDLVLKKAYADQNNARNVIAVNLQNPNAAYMFDLDTKINIYKKGTREPYLTSTREKLSVAPNTNFDLYVPLDSQKLEPGKYQAVVRGTWKENSWTLKKDFEIAGSTAKELNEKDIELKNQPDNHYLWWIIAGLAIALLILAIYLTKERRKKK